MPGIGGPSLVNTATSASAEQGLEQSVFIFLLIGSRSQPRTTDQRRPRARLVARGFMRQGQQSAARSRRRAGADDGYNRNNRTGS